MCENINIVSSLYQSSSTPFQSDKKQKYQSGREYSPNLVSDVNIKCTYIPGHTWPRQDFVFVETVPCYYITHTAITSGFLILKQISAWLSCYSFSFASYIVTIVTGRVLSYYSFSFALYIVGVLYSGTEYILYTPLDFQRWKRENVFGGDRRNLTRCAGQLRYALQQTNKKNRQASIHPSIQGSPRATSIH